MTALTHAIPGPGDEMPAEPDTGVKDEEKVTVVFMVGRALWTKLPNLNASVRAGLTPPANLGSILRMPREGS